MIEGLEPTNEEFVFINELLDTIKAWENVLEFYGGRNYDNGVVARHALDKMTEQDRKVWANLKENSRNIRKLGDELNN